MHGAGLLHRDIKPDNVMLRPEGTPVLIDFGTGRQAIGGPSWPLPTVLTPGYAPIEQYYNARVPQGPWTDIYALGAVAYWALSGAVPEAATARVRAARLPPVARAARVPVSARLAAAVDAALAVDAAARPQSLEEWRAMLDRPPVKEPDASEAIEAALGLERSALRAIQEGLAAAGFDPGGADGVFGAGTRSALRAWQAQQGVAGTGYLTATSAAELRAAVGGQLVRDASGSITVRTRGKITYPI